MFLNISYLEWVGYLGSVVVAISLTMSSIVKLRWLNLAGATIFSFYGFAIAALPVGFLNLFIVLADIYYLIKMYSKKESFKAIITNLNDPYVRFFLDFYKAEINIYFSDFDSHQQDTTIQNQQPFTFLLIRNSRVAGIFSGIQIKEVLQVNIDFVIPEYRDFKSGVFIYKENIQFIKNQGITTLLSCNSNVIHQKYLIKMGFERQTNREAKIVFSKKI